MSITTPIGTPWASTNDAAYCRELRISCAGKPVTARIALKPRYFQVRKARSK
jgi:hypothetical protein